MLELTVDGQTVRVLEGSTILDACRQAGIDTPTLCYGDTLTPVNVCRVCVVELEGARTLVPSCSRKAEAAWSCTPTRSACARAASSCSSCSARRSTSRSRRRRSRTSSGYDAKPERFGPDAATVAQDVKIDNDLYVRDYSKCILCYRCVEACGVDHQNTFAIARRRARLRRAHLHRARRDAPRVGVRLLRQLHRGVPDRRADVEERVRPAPGGHLGRVAADRS